MPLDPHNLLPSTNGTNGHAPRDDRDARGRFVKGNRGGPGNPHAHRVQKLREAGWDSVKPAEVKKVFRKLLSLALAGDVQAAKLLLDRLLGPAVEIDILKPGERGCCN